MVETNTSRLNSRCCSPNIVTQNSNYLTTAMLLGSQGCGYLEQRLQNHLRERSEIEQQQQQQQRSSGTTPTSLFTIDSILAPNKPPVDSLIKTESPNSSPSSSANNSPLRPTRVPAILHPGLHLGHIAAAAASGFGSPSDFLGIFVSNRLC